MTQFAIGRYGSSDWRLLRYDGTETEIAGPNSSVSGWTSEPTLRDAATALMDFHSPGSSPFSSREATFDSLEIANQWPLPARDMTLDDETMPWNN